MGVAYIPRVATLSSIKVATVFLRIKNHLDHLLQYLLTPRLAPFIAAILTVLALNPLSESVTRQYADLAYKNSEDFESYMSVRLHELADKKTVWNFGGSGMMRALGDDFVLEKAFNDHFAVHNLSYVGQTAIESLALIRAATIRPGDIVVFHASISRINRTLPTDIRLCRPAIHSIYIWHIEAVMADLSIPLVKISPFCRLSLFTKWPVIKQIAINGYAQLSGAPVPHYKGIYPQWFELKKRRLKKKREDILEVQQGEWFGERWLSLDSIAGDKFIDIVGEAYKLVNAKGARLVVIDPPQNVAWFKRNHPYMDAPFLTGYKEIAAKISALGVRYHDLRKLKRFRYGDFYDHQHMVTSGRDKFYPIYRDIILKEDRLGIENE